MLSKHSFLSLNISDYYGPALAAIEKKDFILFDKWIKAHDADQLDQNDRTLADLFIDHVLNWKGSNKKAEHEEHILALSKMFFALIDTNGMKKQSEETKFIMVNLFDKFLDSKGINSIDLKPTEFKSGEHDQTCAMNVYTHEDKKFNLQALLQINAEDVDEKRYEKDDFYANGEIDFKVKMGNILITFVTHHIWTITVETIDALKRTTEILYDFTDRKQLTELKFEAIIPFDFIYITLSVHYPDHPRFTGTINWPNTISSLKDAWKIRNDIVTRILGHLALENKAEPNEKENSNQPKL